MKKRILIILLNIVIVLFLVACEPNEIKKNDENIKDEDNPGLVEDNNDDDKTDENDDSNDEKEYEEINIKKMDDSYLYSIESIVIKKSKYYDKSLVIDINNINPLFNEFFLNKELVKQTVEYINENFKKGDKEVILNIAFLGDRSISMFIYDDKSFYLHYVKDRDEMFLVSKENNIIDTSSLINKLFNEYIESNIYDEAKSLYYQLYENTPLDLEPVWYVMDEIIINVNDIEIVLEKEFTEILKAFNHFNYNFNRATLDQIKINLDDCIKVQIKSHEQKNPSNTILKTYYFTNDGTVYSDEFNALIYTNENDANYQELMNYINELNKYIENKEND